MTDREDYQRQVRELHDELRALRGEQRTLRGEQRTMTLEGTMYVKLAAPITSHYRARHYPAGSIVAVSFDPASDVLVWKDESPPVLATFQELVGSEPLSRVAAGLS